MSEEAIITEAELSAIYLAYDHLKQQQGGLSAVSIGKLACEAGVRINLLQEFLKSEARAFRVDLHPTTLLWNKLQPEDREGAFMLPHSPEPFIMATIRERAPSTVALPKPSVTEAFVDQCLDLGADPAAAIVEIAEGKSIQMSLLDQIKRQDVIEWLADEIDGLIEHKNYEPGVAQNLLAYLEETQALGAAGIEVKVERCDPPEQSFVRPEEYIQEFLASITFEGVEIAERPQSGSPAAGFYVCASGQYKDGEWMGNAVEWPEGLRALIDLPEVMIDTPEAGELTEDVEEEPERSAERRERSLSAEIKRGAATTRGNQSEISTQVRPPQSPELPGLRR